MQFIQSRSKIFTSKLLTPKQMSHANFHDVSYFRVVNRHGPDHCPTLCFLENLTENIVPAKYAPQSPLWLEGRVVKLHRWIFSNIRKFYKVAHMISGHRVCKTPRLLEYYLGRYDHQTIPTSQAHFKHSRNNISTQTLLAKKNAICKFHEFSYARVVNRHGPNHCST